MTTLTKAKQFERDDAIAHLRKLLKPGDTIFTTVRHVSRSGMSRNIDAYKITDGEPRWLSGYVATALGRRRTRDLGVVCGGCGMDMGFELVYSLSRTLFPDGFDCIGEGDGYGTSCLSNDHSNDRTRDYSPGRHHGDGGYALRQRWL